MQPKQRGTIFALAKSMDMIDKSKGKDDPLHLLVAGITGKDSLSGCTLTDAEADAVITELRLRQRGGFPEPPKEHQKESLDGPRKKVWWLMYRLIEYDLQPSTAEPVERLRGIVKRTLKLDIVPADPLDRLTYVQISEVIECLKRYVNSAKRKKEKGERLGLPG